MKTEEILDLSKEEKWFAICSILGWANIKEQDYYASPTDAEQIKQYWSGINPETKNQEALPELTLDLMAEAEKLFDIKIEEGNSPRYRYAHYLYDLCPKGAQPFRASLQVRVDAFLLAYEECFKS